ncbi:VOC family protein [Parvularcula sp. LCG005]|uniref:VOC family protein n=1 Tax=Parvularcula sp. LCG005 TaxID=3078805 RepID=UPI0029433D51|nr:VOC family protein [Parvularcula sp. LCG005]WOI54347.1 VOC family protein [Parvularcula sp. LCG005]
MSTENAHHSINYIEFRAPDLPAIITFYSEVFGWQFQKWGDAYISFSGAGVEGGFERGPAQSGGALVILYSDDLEESMTAVEDAGGNITERPYVFPGGRRFHFSDPAGNILAVWSAAEPN